jgi:hypothetical protein
VGYGTMRTMTRLRRHPTLGAAVLDDYERLRCSSYLRATYPFLGRVAVILPLAGLAYAGLERLFGERVFVRPDSNFKLFASRVLAVRDVESCDAEQAGHCDELVVVAAVVELGPEYRCFFRRGTPIGSSSYPTLPYAAAPAEILAFAAQVARTLPDIPMISVDVAVGPDGRLRLVEIGGVNSWGLYGVDPDAFIAALEAEATEPL